MATFALVAAIAVLVLGLIAMTKASFDEIDATVRRTAEGLLEVDRALADFGPDAQPLRARLKSAAAVGLDRLSSRTAASSEADTSGHAASFDQVVDAVRGLQPQDARQRALQARALAGTQALANAHTAMLTTEPSAVSPAVVAIVIFWLAATFAGYALYRRAETLAAPLLGALAAAGLLFLIVELATPLAGAIQVSREPVQRALDLMNAPSR